VFALVLISGFLWFVDNQRTELDTEVTREFLAAFRAAHEMSPDDLNEYLDSRSERRKDLVFWGAQRTPGVRDLSRAGSADWIALPPNLPSGWITTSGTRGISDRKPEDFRVRGKAALIEPAAGSNRATVIFVGRDPQREVANVRNTVYLGIGAFAAVVIFLLVSATLTTRFVVSRIRDISIAAEEIIQGDFTRRIKPGPSNDEFDQLSNTLNFMLDRIQKLLSGVKEVSDNIAHDLRTPLLRLRSRIELALIPIERDGDAAGAREALELTLKEADRLLTTFNALLSIARIESGAMRDHIAEVDLSDIVKDVAELYAPVAEDRTLRLETHVEPGLKIRANRALIVQALSNLVDNALKYAPKGTRIFIAAQSAEPARLWHDSVDLIVADQGPGIAPSDRARVLQRFVRLDPAETTPGSGLGLSLVSAIASLHDAALLLEDGADGIGLTVRLRFTAAV